MIVSGQITRDFALKELAKSMYDAEDMDNTKVYVLDKLGITQKEFEDVLSESPKQHTDYKTDKITAFVDKIRL